MTSQTVELVDICRALVNQELVYYYQPIVSLITGKICAAEALIRWKKEDGNVILPGEFIPLAEEKGLINDITREMLPVLMKNIRTLTPQLDSDFYISVNLSEKDITDESLTTIFERELSRNGISSSRVCAEITEQIFMPLNEKSIANIFNLSDLGIKIALDDFSAGHSTLENLTNLPISILKLAMKITRLAPSTRNDFRLLRHLVSLAHQLNLDTVAEGVETEEEFHLLTSTGCTATQGFYFSHPLPLEEFQDLLSKQPSWSEYPFGLEYLAQIDHIDFRRDIIREALTIHTNPDPNARKRASKRLPDLDPESCLMGKWFNNINWQWHEKADLEELNKLHLIFHEKSRLLISAASKNQTRSEINKLINELTDISLQLMDNLQRISIIGIQNHYEEDK